MRKTKILSILLALMLLSIGNVLAKDLQWQIGLGFNSQLSPNNRINALSIKYWPNSGLCLQGILGFQMTDIQLYKRREISIDFVYQPNGTTSFPGQLGASSLTFLTHYEVWKAPGDIQVFGTDRNSICFKEGVYGKTGCNDLGFYAPQDAIATDINVGMFDMGEVALGDVTSVPEAYVEQVFTYNWFMSLNEGHTLLDLAENDSWRNHLTRRGASSQSPMDQDTFAKC